MNHIPPQIAGNGCHLKLAVDQVRHGCLFVSSFHPPQGLFLEPYHNVVVEFMFVVWPNYLVHLRQPVLLSATGHITHSVDLIVVALDYFFDLLV